MLRVPRYAAWLIARKRPRYIAPPMLPGALDRLLHEVYSSAVPEMLRELRDNDYEFAANGYTFEGGRVVRLRHE